MNISSVFENLSNYENLTNITKTKRPYFCTNVDYFNILVINIVILTLVHKNIPEKIGKVFKPQNRIFKELCESQTYVSTLQTVDLIYLFVMIFVANGWL